MELTLAAALIAGLLSFLSPCVLPVVPAYLGQLGIVAVTQATVVTAPAAASTSSAVPSPVLAGAGPSATGAPVLTTTSRLVATRRSRYLPHALAFVLGFGAIFTLFGLTAYIVGNPLAQNVPLLRQIGGVLLIVLGLNLAGILRLSLLTRSWKPLERFGSRPMRPAAARTPLSAFGLGAIFAVGWTPCVGPTLGAILALSAFGTTPQAALLLVAYSIGLGVPFLVMALAFDRLHPFTRRLVRHARKIELVGGGLVMVIGLAMLFDWLFVFYQMFARFFPNPA